LRYKNFSLAFDFLITFLAIESKDKHWSIMAPRYLTDDLDSIVYFLVLSKSRDICLAITTYILVAPNLFLYMKVLINTDISMYLQ